MKYCILLLLVATGGCLATTNKNNLKRPDFSESRPAVAKVETSCCCSTQPSDSDDSDESIITSLTIPNPYRSSVVVKINNVIYEKNLPSSCSMTFLVKPGVYTIELWDNTSQVIRKYRETVR